MEPNKKFIFKFSFGLIFLWLLGVESLKGDKKSKNSKFVIGRIPPGNFEYAGEAGSIKFGRLVNCLPL